MFTIVRHLGPVLTVLESDDLDLLYDLWKVEDSKWEPSHKEELCYYVEFGNGSGAEIVIDLPALEAKIESMSLHPRSGLMLMLGFMVEDEAACEHNVFTGTLREEEITS